MRKVKCADGVDRVQCGTCHNWFHFECSSLSKKSFTKLIGNFDETYLCNICKRKTFCVSCNCDIVTSKESVYCVGCLNKFCQTCLSLENSQFQILTDTEKSYFCPECSIDHFCNVCSKLCVDGCIFCDSCHSWVHYCCSKLKKSQVIIYAKTSKM